jgi:hypothetical protein
MYSKPLIVVVLSIMFVVLVYSPTSVFDLNATTPKFGGDFNAPQTGEGAEGEPSVDEGVAEDESKYMHKASRWGDHRPG